MVSVIIPYHNDKDTIHDAVNSVLAQTYKDFEIIIVDDISERKIPDDILKCDKVKVIRSDRRVDASGARNMGVAAAEGEYVAFLDADDIWASDKLAKQMKVMEKFRIDGEAPVLCFTGRRLIKADAKLSDTISHGSGFGGKGRFIGCDKIVRYDKLLLSNQINCSSVLIRRSAFDGNSFPEGRLHEDYAMWLKLLKKGGYAAGINRPLICYRMSKGSRSGNRMNSAVMTYRVYRYTGLSVLRSMRYMISYTARGFSKYYL